MLSDTQLVVLSTAAARPDRSVLPITLSLKGAAATRVFASLLKKELVAESPVAADEPAWRKSDEGQRLGLALTDAGLEALGIEPETEAAKGRAPASESPRETGRVPGAGGRSDQAGPGEAAQPAGGGAKRKPKSTLILERLREGEGANLAELQALTGWQPHSVRAVLSGIRKQGIEVVRFKDEAGTTRYRVDAGARGAS